MVGNIYIGKVIKMPERETILAIIALSVSAVALIFGILSNSALAKIGPTTLLFIALAALWLNRNPS